MEKLERFMGKGQSLTPELLLPAGNLEKLKVAILYGANAVYVGGQKFGLRSRADNFTEVELAEGVQLAHSQGVKVYVVLNAFLHDKDLLELTSFVQYLEKISVDAVIISDLGVLSTVRKLSQIPVHLSTQASCLNVPAAKLWKKMGVKRIVVGRELSIKEAGLIKREAQVEVEMFIHGSMCMAYSGNCTISNYTAGRDSNRGGCAHSCRFEYSLDFLEAGDSSSVQAFFMNAKDLQGMGSLPDFFHEEIDSLKIEGRMKSQLYVGTLSKIYSEALKDYGQTRTWDHKKLVGWERELNKMVHRGPTSGNLQETAKADSVNWWKESEKEEDYVVVGNILENHDQDFMLVEVKNAFSPGEELELLPFDGPFIAFSPEEIKSVKNEFLEKTRPNTLVKLPAIPTAKPWNILRKRVSK